MTILLMIPAALLAGLSEAIQARQARHKAYLASAHRNRRALDIIDFGRGDINV